MKSLLLRLAAVALVSGSSAFAAAGRSDIAGIIAKGRAYYGTEAALNSVKSIHLVGSLVTIVDVDDKDAKPILADVEIVFQAPYKQKITATSTQGTEVTALDGFDAWHRIEDKSTPPRWNFTLQGSEEIKRLRANTNEQLSFFRGTDLANMEDMGTATINGVICHKLAIKYAKDIVFYDYIDQVTGRLVQVETGQGGRIADEGEIVANGIKFPKKRTTTVKQPSGKTATVTVTFTKVTINETFPADYFAVPSLANK